MPIALHRSVDYAIFIKPFASFKFYHLCGFSQTIFVLQRCNSRWTLIPTSVGVLLVAQVQPYKDAVFKQLQSGLAEHGSTGSTLEVVEIVSEATKCPSCIQRSQLRSKDQLHSKARIAHRSLSCGRYLWSSHPKFTISACLVECSRLHFLPPPLAFLHRVVLGTRTPIHNFHTASPMSLCEMFLLRSCHIPINNSSISRPGRSDALIAETKFRGDHI
jgi:hypothetical protein